MAEENKTGGNVGGAIIPAGSQLGDPVAAGQPAASNPGQVDPFNNPNWLATDAEFNPQKSLDADPVNPGVDVFGGNINDLPQDITIPVSTPAPEVETPAPVVPLAQAPVEPTPVQPAEPVQPEPIVTPTPITVAPETLAAAAIAADPKDKALNKLVDQVVAPKTRRNIALIVIFILLVLVFVLSSTTVYLLINGPVNVTINTGKTGSSSSQTTTTATSASTSTTTSTAALPESIYSYMVLLSSDHPGEEVKLADLPEGSVKLSDGYLVRVLLDENIATDDPVKESLTKLFAIKDATYGDEGYHNYLSRANLTVETKKGEGDSAELEVNLLGEFTTAQDADIVYAKQQIERTIENYTLNYKIMLNGSESAYTCVGSSDASCR